ITGDRVQRLEFPAGERDRGMFCRRPQWLDDGRLIECEWFSAVPCEPSVFWRFDAKCGTVRKLGDVPDDSLLGVDGKPHICTYVDASAEREVRCATKSGDRTAVFSVVDDRGVVVPRRPFPYPLTEGFNYPTRRTGRLIGIDVHFVPGA